MMSRSFVWFTFLCFFFNSYYSESSGFTADQLKNFNFLNEHCERNPKSDTCSYLRDILKYQSKLQTDAKDSLSKISFLEVSPTASYQHIFETLIMKQKSFKGLQKQSSLLNLDHSICRLTPKNFVTHDISLSNCWSNSQLKDFVMPSIVSNNYVRYLYSTHIEATSDDIDIVNQWPSILYVDRTPTKIHSCPSRMHQIIWGGNTEVKVRIFHIASSAVFQPIFSNHISTQNISEGHTSLQYPVYLKTGFENEIDAPFKEFTLKQAEFTFIPSTYLTSFTLSETHSKSEPSFIYRMCYVDATNLNEFKESIGIYARVSERFNFMLKSLLSPSFDVSMQRHPQDISLKDYFSNATTDTETIDNSKKAKSKKKRTKKGKANVDFKDWQEFNKWNQLISSLTIPKPSTPAIFHTGRTNVTLEWTSGFLPQSNDKSTFGFDVFYCETIEGNSEVISNSSDSSTTFCQSVKVLRGNDQLTEIFNIDDQRFTFVFTLVGLLPYTSYRVQVMLLYGEFESLPSEFSSIFRTRELSFPSNVPCDARITSCVNATSENADIILTFLTPYDDGGSPILGYHIFSKRVTSYYKVFQWHYVTTTSKDGMLSSSIDVQIVRVSNLPSNVSLHFSIQPFNAIGNATTSVASNIITTVPLVNQRHRIYGSHKSRPSDNHQGERLLLMSDDKQTITINKEVFHVWRSHWTPNMYDVEGYCSWVDPPYADSGIENSDNLKGKIAFVWRGESPLFSKVHAIESTGAIGVVIVDNSLCNDYNQRCLPGANKNFGEGFARLDSASHWEDVRIPVVFILQKPGLQLSEKAKCPFFKNIHNDIFEGDL